MSNMTRKGTLRGIKFKHAECNILAVEHFQRVLVRWGLEKTTQDLSKLVFVIYRGESPSEMSRINSQYILANMLYEYVDDTPKLKIASKNYYYQVIAQEMVDGVVVQEFQSEVVSWQDGQDLVSQYIIDEHLFEHEHVSGTPVFLYKKKTEGPRCTNCWDKVLKRVTSSSCKECMGTGFINGYYKAIPCWMKIDPDPVDGQVTEYGIREPSKTRMQFVNYPLLQMGDIVLELDPFQFWRIESVALSEKNRNITLQFPVVNEVNRSDIEQRLEVDQELRKKLIDQLQARMQLPEF